MSLYVAINNYLCSHPRVFRFLVKIKLIKVFYGVDFGADVYCIVTSYTWKYGKNIYIKNSVSGVGQ